ncbi:hypothetical protein T05_16140 [Trichinella murrelli]|uniref:Uncharacterized protein n=1 Tax=Trichinella murrelli TaxID=144512 RepID=A0A0V0SY10_9BILA|nr:hypothetical protein T05_16140 [Trichinella murrelli]
MTQKCGDLRFLTRCVHDFSRLLEQLLIFYPHLWLRIFNHHDMSYRYISTSCK